MVLIFAVFIGAVIVTFNIKVLGGKISYFQSVSILGYCICPIFIALIVVSILKFLQIRNPIVRLILILVGTVWAILGKPSIQLSCQKFHRGEFAELKEIGGFIPNHSILLLYCHPDDLQMTHIIVYTITHISYLSSMPTPHALLLPDPQPQHFLSLSLPCFGLVFHD